MNYRSAEHVAALAEELRTELECNPDLLAVATMAEKLCTDDPQVAAQVMLALAAWLPPNDGVNERTARTAILAGIRMSNDLPNLALPGVA